MCLILIRRAPWFRPFRGSVCKWVKAIGFHFTPGYGEGTGNEEGTAAILLTNCISHFHIFRERWKSMATQPRSWPTHRTDVMRLTWWRHNFIGIVMSCSFLFPALRLVGRSFHLIWMPIRQVFMPNSSIGCDRAPPDDAALHFDFWFPTPLARRFLPVRHPHLISPCLHSNSHQEEAERNSKFQETRRGVGEEVEEVGEEGGGRKMVSDGNGYRRFPYRTPGGSVKVLIAP